MVHEPLRRLTLETARAFISADWVVVATWLDDTLYIGQCDFGNGDEMTSGFDIDDPDALLAWMIADRFGNDGDALEGYAARVGIDSRDRQGLTLVLLADRCQGVDAWDRVEQLARQAGVTTTRRDRGYV